MQEEKGVGAFLAGLGLEELEENFRNNDYRIVGHLLEAELTSFWKTGRSERHLRQMTAERLYVSCRKTL